MRGRVRDEEAGHDRYMLLKLREEELLVEAMELREKIVVCLGMLHASDHPLRAERIARLEAMLAALTL